MKFVDFMPEEFAAEIDPKELSTRPLGIISITDPGRQATLKPGWADVLRLQFNDVDPEYLAQLDDPEGKVLFNEEHAKKIVEWVNKNKGRLYGTIVHCWAGISRSGAVAKFIADKFGLPFRREQEEFINHYIYDLLQKADRGASSKQANVTRPPTVIRYQGRTYRLREGAAPEAAQQRLQQVEEALAALEQNGYPTNLPPKMKKKWTINSDDILKSIDTMDGSPMLLMWNPITSELLMSSDLDVNAPYHSILHSQYRNEVQKYPYSDYGDWVRGMYDSSSNKVTIYKWEPLVKYMVHMSPEDRKKAEELQVRAVKAFGKMLSSQGAGGDVSTTEQFIPR